MLEGFAPIADNKARILILGTMPSVASLKTKQYYGHPQNAFWPIIFSLWDEEPPADYNKRVSYLIAKKIALWDVLQFCEREGSADSAIKRPIPNDFVSLAKICPDLETVFFNSLNASQLFKKLVKPDAFEFLPKIVLPSTSPARAMRFEKKRQMWLSVRIALEQSNNV